ncbi:MAG TPA: tetratricopeptide repeat protein, partial [Spirochaetales bacterium]|nr:tetratricopeptide repeat protein [Spirochaetales bacterium]
MRKRIFARSLCVAFCAFALSGAYAQAGTASSVDSLRSGIQLFAEGRYEEALPVFDALFLDTSAGSLRPEGAYWSAMTHMAKGDAAAGLKATDTFLALYPTHARAAEMQYQRGRAGFILRDYELALQSFSAYLSAYPKADNVSSAIFWSAESLYAVGRLSEAEKLYRTVAEKYPDSVKAEAARYRIALVQFKYREDELLTLLKWSHEESLRIIEEFQRREKAYEQALALYQKRYGES